MASGKINAVYFTNNAKKSNPRLNFILFCSWS